MTDIHERRLDPAILDLERRLHERIQASGAATDSIQLFQELILTYYRHFGRDLPWRRTRDPYAILVSEIMLQQTQVEHVVNRYDRFLKQFPDFYSLASAPLKDVLAEWQGLGYNRRAIALKKTAERVVGEFDGVLPSDVEVLTTFPGIGKATAAAIAAYAFNLPTVFIETNIRRVFIHFFCPGREGVKDAEIEPLVVLALVRDNPRAWYYALMDYGSRLKKRVANPNRRSAAYQAQGIFEGSDRQVRGEILRFVLAEGEVSVDALIAELGGDGERIRTLLEALEKEGFLTSKKGMIAPAGEER